MNSVRCCAGVVLRSRTPPGPGSGRHERIHCCARWGLALGVRHFAQVPRKRPPVSCRSTRHWAGRQCGSAGGTIQPAGCEERVTAPGHNGIAWSHGVVTGRGWLRSPWLFRQCSREVPAGWTQEASDRPCCKTGLPGVVGLSRGRVGFGPQGSFGSARGSIQPAGRREQATAPGHNRIAWSRRVVTGQGWLRSPWLFRECSRKHPAGWTRGASDRPSRSQPVAGSHRSVMEPSRLRPGWLCRSWSVNPAGWTRSVNPPSAIRARGGSSPIPRRTPPDTRPPGPILASPRCLHPAGTCAPRRPRAEAALFPAR